MIGGIHSQNSIIQNHDFETTNWQDIAWFSQTNTGSPIIVNQSDAFFIKDDIFAHSGLHFAYIGGVQSPAGLYEGDLVQEFYVPMSGNGQLYFSVRYIQESTDPGSLITISIDDHIVWSVQPHYIVDYPEDYMVKLAEIGYLEAGNHTISIHGYENPLGGDAPMQFAFDDFNLNVIASPASVENEENIDLNVFCSNGNIQIQSIEAINKDAVIELLDLSGKVISSSVTYFQHSYTLPVNSFNSGMYILNIKTNKQTISKKLFIQN